MNCCDAWGNCTRGPGCPSGPVAKIGNSYPADVEYDEQEQDDAMGAMRMLAYALVSLALVGAAVTLAVFITIFNQP